MVITSIGVGNSNLKPATGQILSLALHPTLAEIAAVGYNNGTVIILNIRSGKILFRAAGCSDEIQNLAFSPPSLHDGSCYLVYASKDKTLGLLSIDVSSTVQQLGTHKIGKGDPNRSWTSLCWLDSTKFLSSTSSGDILAWTAPKMTSTKWVHAHPRAIFQLVPCLAINTVISISMDRNINCWDWNTKSKLWDMATLGGYVYQISESPVDSSLIAMACGDNSIRVWLADECLSRLTSSSDSASGSLFSVQLLWKGITSKVTCIQWHPNSSDMLVFGLEDGRVFFQTLEKSVSKQTKLSHKQAVYAVSFLRDYIVPSESATIMAASAAGDGTILLHSQDSASFDLNTWILQSNSNILQELSMATGKQLNSFGRRVSFDFDLDMKRLLIGNADGTLELYSWPELALLGCTRTHNRMINRIKWKLGGGLVATASEDGAICVFQCDNSTPSSLKLLHKIQAHHKSINDICWSDFENRPMLVSASADGTLLYWDALNGTCIGAEESSKPVKRLAVAWNRQWKDCVLNAGEDQSLVVNRFSLRSPAPITSETRDATPTTQDANRDATNSASLPSNTSTQATVSSATHSSNTSKAAQKRPDHGAAKSKGTPGSARTSHASASHASTALFPGISWKDSKDPLQDISMWITHPSMQSKEAGALEISQPTDESMNLPEVAISQHFIAGDIADAILLAIQHGKLNDMWVALSASGGAHLWQKACSAYAELLVSKSDSHKAVLYYLAIRDLDKAIGVYENAGMFSDALRVAREKLPEGHPRLNAIWINFANYLVHRSQPENAAKCYLAIGDLESAANILAGIDSERTALLAFQLMLKHYEKCLEVDVEKAEQGERLKRTISEIDTIHAKVEGMFWKWVDSLVSRPQRKEQNESAHGGLVDVEALIPAGRLQEAYNAAKAVGNDTASLLLLYSLIWTSAMKKSHQATFNASFATSSSVDMEIDTMESDPITMVVSLAQAPDLQIQQNDESGESSVWKNLPAFLSRRLQLARSVLFPTADASSLELQLRRLHGHNEKLGTSLNKSGRLISTQLATSAVLSSAIGSTLDCSRSLCRLFLSHSEDLGDEVASFVLSIAASNPHLSPPLRLSPFLDDAFDIVLDLCKGTTSDEMTEKMLRKSVPSSAVPLEEEAVSLRLELSRLDRGSKKRKHAELEDDSEEGEAAGTNPSTLKKPSSTTAHQDSAIHVFSPIPASQETLEERLKIVGDELIGAREISSSSSAVDVTLLFEAIQRFGKKMLGDREAHDGILSQPLLALMKRTSLSVKDFVLWKGLS